MRAIASVLCFGCFLLATPLFAQQFTYAPGPDGNPIVASINGIPVLYPVGEQTFTPQIPQAYGAGMTTRPVYFPPQMFARPAFAPVAPVAPAQASFGYSYNSWSGPFRRGVNVQYNGYNGYNGYGAMPVQPYGGNCPNCQPGN